MERIALGILGLLAIFSASAEQRTSPQPHCIDARQIGGAEGISSNTLGLRLKDGQRFKVELAQDCPAPEGRLSVRGSKDGWLCAEPGESLVIGDAQCPISTIAPLDTRSYADLLRQRDRQVATLETLQIEAASQPPSRGFRGTADYCVGIDAVRSWSEGPQGITVEVSPNRAAGNRFYRIEVASGCPALANSQTMTLVSGMGLGMVCGHPGDRMALGRPERELIRPGDRANFSGRYDCQISRVYPVQDKNES